MNIESYSEKSVETTFSPVTGIAIPIIIPLSFLVMLISYDFCESFNIISVYLSPKVRLEDIAVQCNLINPEQNDKLEEQFRETVKLNSSLAEELGAAKKEIEVLRGRLKELEVLHLYYVNTLEKKQL